VRAIRARRPLAREHHGDAPPLVVRRQLTAVSAAAPTAASVVGDATPEDGAQSPHDVQRTHEFEIARATGLPVLTGVASAPPTKSGAIDGVHDENGASDSLEAVAVQIYDIIRRRIGVDLERAGARPAWFQG
jgi:hypothetical protein